VAPPLHAAAVAAHKEFVSATAAVRAAAETGQPLGPVAEARDIARARWLEAVEAAEISGAAAQVKSECEDATELSSALHLGLDAVAPDAERVEEPFQAVNFLFVGRAFQRGSFAAPVGRVA